MPGSSEIRSEIQAESINPYDIIRKKYLKEYATYCQRDVILYASAFSSHKISLLQIPSIFTSINDEDLKGFMSSVHDLKNENLDLILHSPGGFAETTKQIVNYLREKYSNIRAIIPQKAMSAATMLACGCDEIIMTKHSCLGPIDPQITLYSDNQAFSISAQAILDEFDTAKREIIENKDLALLWVNRINKYPSGFYNDCVNQIELSKDLVRSWLSEYMFKGDSKGEDKAGFITEWLGNANNHKSHGNPLNYKDLQIKGLKVKLIEEDQKQQDILLSIYHATMELFEAMPTVKIIENHKGFGKYWNVNPSQ